jgi:hypothetical protein
VIWQDYIPPAIRDLYEIHDFRHAAAILSTELSNELRDLLDALGKFRITTKDILDPGGNESRIPKLVSEILRPLGWEEGQLHAEMKVDGIVRSTDTHKVDYLKGRVAFDLEWNSKDQTFDRDLFAFRTFHELEKISVGILLTRSSSLNPVFEKLGVKTKYGASTTWMGKLLPRIQAGRGGGCPILVFGITPKLISDWVGE